MKFGLLTTTDAPLLGHLIKELMSINAIPDIIIFDSKGIQEKDKAIHEDRTEGKIPVIPLNNFKVKIPTYFVESHNDENCIDIIVKKKIDLLVNAGTPRILKGKILNITKQGIINCHPGLLPDFKGCSCVEWAIYYDKKVGNTIH
jgi:methionyl-tRNA formyltransferase